MEVLYNAKGAAEPWRLRSWSVASRTIFRTWSLFINIWSMGFEECIVDIWRVFTRSPLPSTIVLANKDTWKALGLSGSLCLALGFHLLWLRIP